MKTTDRLREDALSALLQWNDARLKANGLRAHRDSLRCECASPAEPEVGDPGVAPCWQARFEQGDAAEMCEPCAARQEIHGKAAAASREQSRLRQKMQRLAAKLAAPTTTKGRKLHLGYAKSLIIDEVRRNGAASILTGWTGTDAEAIAALEADPRAWFVVSKDCDKQGPDGSCEGHEVPA